MGLKKIGLNSEGGLVIEVNYRLKQENRIALKNDVALISEWFVSQVLLHVVLLFGGLKPKQKCEQTISLHLVTEAYLAYFNLFLFRQKPYSDVSRMNKYESKLQSVQHSS